MAEIIKLGQYDPANLASVAFHFGRQGKDAPILALLAEGADPEAVDRFGFTALHRAIHFDRQAVVDALLRIGADPNRITKSGATPLMSVKSAAVARMLLEAGADVNAVTWNSKTLLSGRTALMNAARKGNLEVAALLLEHGANVNQRDEENCNALTLAVQAEKSELVQLLLDAGAEVGLIEAAMLGDLAKFQALLDAGANQQPQQMEQSLRWAAVVGQTDAIALLLDNGTFISASDNAGNTALMQAALFGRAATVRLLLERGAAPNVINRRGTTALMSCLESSTRRSFEIVELLLTHGAQAGVRSESGWTPLMLACLWGNGPAVALLLEYGADVHVFTNEEASAREGLSTSNALMLAVANGHIEVVKLLLAYGADPLAYNNNARCALDTARRGNEFKRSEREQILPLLEDLKLPLQNYSKFKIR